MDRIASIQDEIQEIRNEMSRFQRIEKHLEHLNHVQETLHSALRRLTQMLEREKSDLEQLQSLSIRGLFLKILGNLEEQLEIERQEYLIVALKYNAVTDQCNLVEYERDLLESRLARRPEMEKKLESLLSEKAEILRTTDKNFNIKLQLIAYQLMKRHTTLVELDEVIAAGTSAKQTLAAMRKELEHLQDWGDITYYGKGRYSSYKKKGLIDNLRDKSSRAGVLLDTFERQMRDVRKSNKNPGYFHLESFEGFLNTFYENLITDWIVRQGIKNAHASVIQAMDKVERYLATFRLQKRQTTEKVEKLEQERRTLILNADP